MNKTSTKKVCIIVYALGGGGAERSSATLSQILYDLGYDVHIATVLDMVDYPYKGKLVNLGKLKAQDDSFFGRIKRLKYLKSYLKKNEFDYVVDGRTRIGFFKEFIISKYLYAGIKSLYIVHSFKINNYINPNVFFGRLIYSKAYKIITVSKGIQNKLENKYGFKNVLTLYNAFNSKDISFNNEESAKNYILFFGRLNDEIKNITLLLNAYKHSLLRDKSIDLKILGEGTDLEKLKQIVSNLNLKDTVEFLPYRPNPYDVVQKAMFTVLTSRYEGFPMVIPEALALGVPVVSVDCKSGPNEVIVNEQNGLLVENHNVEAFAKAMNRMIEDKDLYLRCKANAKSSVEHLSKENIGKQWKAILQ